MVRRATIIALRSRHAAHRIARDILYPQQSPPEQQPVSFPTYDEDAAVGPVIVDREWADQLCEAAEAAKRRMLTYAVMTISVLCAIVALGICVKTSLYPSMPPAQPPVSAPVQPMAPR